MSRRSSRAHPALLLLLAGCAAAAAKATPVPEAPRAQLALASALALAPSETGHVALDTGRVLLIRQLVQSGHVLWADTVATFAPAAPAPVVTPPPVVVTQPDTTPAHVTVSLGAVALHVGDTLRITASCYYRGDSLYTATGGFYASPSDTTPFGPFVGRPPLQVVARRPGTTAVRVTCWPQGPSGIGATSPLVTVSSAAPTDTVVAHISIADAAGHIYARDDTLLDTVRVDSGATKQLCALASNAAGEALWNSCSVSPASGRVVPNGTYWRLAMAWLDRHRRGVS